MYNKAMKKLFKKLPTMKSKPFSQDKNTVNCCHKLVVGGIMTMVLPPIIKQKLSKNHKIKIIKLNVNYTLIIGIGIIEIPITLEQA